MQIIVHVDTHNARLVLVIIVIIITKIGEVDLAEDGIAVRLAGCHRLVDDGRGLVGGTATIHLLHLLLLLLLLLHIGAVLVIAGRRIGCSSTRDSGRVGQLLVLVLLLVVLLLAAAEEIVGQEATLRRRRTSIW